tara:strand:- start:2020 stop:2262 length:243 start_codon:yes stop_codon:yes gene_type:complete
VTILVLAAFGILRKTTVDHIEVVVVETLFVNVADPDKGRSARGLCRNGTVSRKCFSSELVVTGLDCTAEDPCDGVAHSSS